MAVCPDAPSFAHFTGNFLVLLYTDPLVRSIFNFSSLSTIFCSLNDGKDLRQLPPGDRSTKGPHSGLPGALEESSPPPPLRHPQGRASPCLST